MRVILLGCVQIWHFIICYLGGYFFSGHSVVCTSIPHLSSRWNWKKTAWSRWTCFGVRVPRHCTIQP